MKKISELSCSLLLTVALLMSSLCTYAFASGNFNVNSMCIGADNNSFSNDTSSFIGSNETSHYYLNPNDYYRLIESESEDVKNLIASQVLSNFEGSCYGISATMALSYVGLIELPSQNYFTVDLSKNKEFRNTVNYYQLIQFCENKTPEKTTVVSNGKAYEDPLKQIVEYAKTGDPFILTFKTEDFAHTVVCCGYEYDDSGAHRIRLIDCNIKNEFIYMVISTSYNAWRFDNCEYNAGDVKELYFSTLGALAPFSPDEESTKVYSTVSGSVFHDIICTSMNSSFTITNKEGNTLTFDRGKLFGDIEIAEIKYVAGGTDALNTKVVIKIDDSDSYNVKNDGDEINLTVVGDDGLFFTVQGTDISEIIAEKGIVTLKGENMNYSVNALSTDQRMKMINFSGSDSSTISFATVNGTTVTDADNGKMHISILSEGQIRETDYDIERDTFSVDYTDVVKSNQVSEPGNSMIKRIIIIFVVLIFAAATLLAYKKYSKKNKDIILQRQDNDE